MEPNKVRIIVAAVTLLAHAEEVDADKGEFTLRVPPHIACHLCGGQIQVKVGAKLVIDNVDKEVKYYHVDCANKSNR